MYKRQVVNSGIKFILYNQTADGWDMYEYLYENGIMDYVKEISAGKEFTPVFTFDAQRRGRDREDKPDYNVKMQFAFCFNNEINMIEYYHNSSFLEHGGAPDKAVRSAFVSAIDAYLKQNNKYTKSESKVTCLLYTSRCV